MRKLIIFTALLISGILSGVYPQGQVSDYYRKIEKKLALDKKYLNIYAVNFQPTAEDLKVLNSIPRAEGASAVGFVSRENVNYQIIILKDNFEIDSMVILMVKKIEDKSGGGESFFGDAGGGSKVDTVTLLTFADVQELYFNSHPAYQSLYDKVVASYATEEPHSLLALNLNDKAAKSRGISSPDNTDFISYQRANSIHRYPAVIEAMKKAAASRRRAPQAVEDNTAAVDFAIDASFSHLSFYHKQMDFGFSSVSAEINTETKGLNIVPYQGMTTTFGIRTLFSLAGTGALNSRQDFLIDAKILGRARVNTYKLLKDIPYIFGDQPLLQVGSGFIFDISGSRQYNLPFFNFYYANGSASSLETPYVKLLQPDKSYVSYFSLKQWMLTLSFFWNSSEERTVRYRCDFGVGNYDVYRVVYTGNQYQKELIYNKIKPFIGFGFSFAPQNIDFMDASLRFYDNNLTMNFWLKLLEISPGQVFRFETSYITTPMFRTKYAWESPNSNAIVQLRYRYGL